MSIHDLRAPVNNGDSRFIKSFPYIPKLADACWLFDVWAGIES